MEAVIDREMMADITAHFQALSSVVPLHPIRNQADYDCAVEVLNRLLDAGAADENHPLADLVGTLGELIVDYDDKHFQIGEALPTEIPRFLMTQYHLTQSDFPEVGSQGVVSKILSGKRSLNTRQIPALVDRFDISPAAFL
jgi:HTH-type transcriptional regulator/antitoxin HigA